MPQNGSSLYKGGKDFVLFLEAALGSLQQLVSAGRGGRERESKLFGSLQRFRTSRFGYNRNKNHKTSPRISVLLLHLVPSDSTRMEVSQCQLNQDKNA